MIHFSMDTKAGQTLFYMMAVLTERIDGLKLSEMRLPKVNTRFGRKYRPCALRPRVLRPRVRFPF